MTPDADRATASDDGAEPAWRRHSLASPMGDRPGGGLMVLFARYAVDRAEREPWLWSVAWFAGSLLGAIPLLPSLVIISKGIIHGDYGVAYGSQRPAGLQR